MGERLWNLERADDAEPGPQVSRQPAQVPALEAKRPAVRRDRAGDEIEDRALAGAVGANHPEARAGRERERHVVGDDDRAEPLAQAGYVEKRRGAQPSCDRSFNSASTGICGAVAL